MKKKVGYFLISLLLTVFLSNKLMPMEMDPTVYNQINSKPLKFIYHFFHEMAGIVSSLTVVDGLVLVGVFFLLANVDKIADFKLSKLQLFLSAILSLGIVFRFSFSLRLGETETSYFYLLVKDDVQLIKTVCTFTSWFIFYNTLQKYFELAVVKLSSMIDFNSSNKTTRQHTKPKTKRAVFLENTGLILAMWIPVLVIDYPGMVIFDALSQLLQFHGYTPFVTQHPITSTLFLNYFFELGNFLGSAKLGIFLGILVQAIILAGALAIIVTLFQIFVKDRRISIGLVFLIGTLPIILSLFTLATKDVIFSGAFLLFNFYLGFSLFNQEPKKYKFIVLNEFIWATIALLFRKNVIYVIALFILYSLVLRAFKNNKYVKFTTLLALALSIFAFKGIDSGLANAYHADNSTLKREALSLPFQQTARYIKYHEDDMTKSELKNIDRVLETNNIGKRYDPLLSNSVKFYFNEKATPIEMKNYFKTWLYEFTQHPVIYFEATIQQNISLISPFDKNEFSFKHINAGYRPGSDSRNQFYKKYKLTNSKTRWSWQEIKIQYFQMFDRLPLVGLLDNPAVYIIGSFFMFALAIKFKLKRTAYLMMPAFFLLLTLIAGPVVQGYTRYTAVFVFLFPLFLLALATEIKQTKYSSLTDTNNKFSDDDEII
ncbi:DUF6020 family protein [Ligilactobacillus pobuzihii]|nr:DUF6020 family protein [Ligilactobacillus pobuzihii]GEN48419.1 hypothetical protein LPO01_12110 [Ligilactobacillus pobuzihii]